MKIDKELYVPFIFPTIALILVIFLAWRWFSVTDGGKKEYVPSPEPVRSCEKYGELRMDELPSRCVKYFTSPGGE